MDVLVNQLTDLNYPSHHLSINDDYSGKSESLKRIFDKECRSIIALIANIIEIMNEFQIRARDNAMKTDELHGQLDFAKAFEAFYEKVESLKQRLRVDRWNYMLQAATSFGAIFVGGVGGLALGLNQGWNVALSTAAAALGSSALDLPGSGIRATGAALLASQGTDADIKSNKADNEQNLRKFNHETQARNADWAAQMSDQFGKTIQTIVQVIQGMEGIFNVRLTFH